MEIKTLINGAGNPLKLSDLKPTGGEGINSSKLSSSDPWETGNFLDLSVVGGTKAKTHTLLDLEPTHPRSLSNLLQQSSLLDLGKRNSELQLTKGDSLESGDNAIEHTMSDIKRYQNRVEETESWLD